MKQSFDLEVCAAFKSTSDKLIQPQDTKSGPSYRHIYIITYVFKGKGYYEVGGKKYALESGDSFLIYPGTLVHYYPDENDKWEYAWVDFRGNEVEELLNKTLFRPENPIILKKDSHKVFERFTDLCEIYEQLITNTDYGAKKIECKAALYNLLAEYIRAYPFPPQNNKSLKEQIANYIYNNFSNPDFTVSKLEKHFSMSHSSFSYFFKDNFKTTPKKYINNLKIALASRMLNRKGVPIKEVALSVGFKDPLYFSRIFKEIKGYAPSEYYEKHVVPNLPFKKKKD